MFTARKNPFVKQVSKEAQAADFLGSKQDVEIYNQWMLENERKNLKLPKSMHEAPFAEYDQIMRGIDEEMKKRHAKDSYDVKFRRMRKEIEELVDDGKTFKN